NHDAILNEIKPAVMGKIVVDAVVPLVPPKVSVVQLPPDGSAALSAQRLLAGAARVQSAFHNVSASKLKSGGPVDCDVLVFGADKEARAIVIELANAAGTRGIDGGPLANSAAAEALTSVLIGINRRYKVDGGAGIRITGIPTSQRREKPNQTAIFSADRDPNLPREEALALVDYALASLMRAAARRRDAAHGSIVSYSRKVFIPLTKLCRDVCHYCTFAHPPRQGERAYLSLDEALAIARAGQAAGCKEALFTLGDQPELRYRTAADELARLGHRTTLSYLAEAARAVHERTGLFPHLNPGHLTPSDVAALRVVSLSQGLMLESLSERLCE